MSSSKADYYGLLGLRRDATQEEIKRAYFEAAQKLHPDRNTAAGETEIFLDVQQAYETLSNPRRRSQYDATLPPEEKLKLPYEHKLICSRSSLMRMDDPLVGDTQVRVEGAVGGADWVSVSSRCSAMRQPADLHWPGTIVIEATNRLPSRRPCHLAPD